MRELNEVNKEILFCKSYLKKIWMPLSVPELQ